MQEFIKKIGYRVSGSFGSGITTLTSSNEELKKLMQIFKSLKDSSFLINDVTQTIENEEKNKEVKFLVCFYVH